MEQITLGNVTRELERLNPSVQFLFRGCYPDKIQVAVKDPHTLVLPEGFKMDDMACISNGEHTFQLWPM